MLTVTLNKYSHESHPWNWYIPTGAKKILIGTFPTAERNRKHDFFYCSSTNRFWEVLAGVPGHNIELLNGRDPVYERKQILLKLSLGLTDMGKVIYRQQGSSKDHSLFPIEFMNIIQILDENKGIDSLIVSGNTQGNSSLSWFNTFCSLNSIDICIKELEGSNSTEINIAGRTAKVFLAYSPSRLSRVNTEKLVEDYRLILGQTV